MQLTETLSWSTCREETAESPALNGTHSLFLRLRGQHRSSGTKAVGPEAVDDHEEVVVSGHSRAGGHRNSQLLQQHEQELCEINPNKNLCTEEEDEQEVPAPAEDLLVTGTIGKRRVGSFLGCVPL